MQRSRLRFVVGASIACAVLLTGCGQAGNDPGASPGADTQPGTTKQPEPSCAGGPLGCAEFTSVRGTDITGDVAWLGTDPLRVSSRRANGEWTLSVHTPCNYLQVAVSVHDDVLTPRWRTATDRGCEEPTGSYQDWTEKLFEQPVQWKLDGDVLTLQNSHGTIELKES